MASDLSHRPHNHARITALTWIFATSCGPGMQEHARSGESAASDPVGELPSPRDPAREGLGASPRCTGFGLGTVDDRFFAVGADSTALAKALAGDRACDGIRVLWIDDLDASDPRLDASILDLDLSPLAAIPSLEQLSIQRCRCQGWDALVALPRLWKLSVGIAEPADVAAIGRLEHLESLNIQGRAAARIEPLARFTRLEELTIQAHTDIDIRPLSLLRSLKRLRLSFNTITDFSPLAGLQLEELELMGTGLSSLDALELSPTLKTLKISSTAVRDLLPLKRCERLKWLDADRTAVESLTPLAELRFLDHLSIAHSRVTDLSPLLATRTLMLLNVEGLQIDPAQLREISEHNPGISVIGEKPADGQDRRP